ncbi:5-oxoproline transporter, DUF969 family subunit [Enorma massiliensis]|uniref:5-oxoproline transporter, DUF969 family subunit n=1 Tax=Enorma massiliensis TaxID=1472761 RepID=UPI002E7623CF|nr:DUF969 family protein [Enorma massiliensis]
MEYLKLIGIVIIVVGFACKLDSILVIMVAAIVTALEAVVEHPRATSLAWAEEASTR